MKKLFLLFFALGTIIQGFSQITFEHTYSISAGGIETPFLTDIGNNNYKWVLFEIYNDKFSLYNLDYTPFILNIQLPISTDSGRVYDIGYITNTLFDCDSTNIEYAIMSFSPRDTLKFAVYRTDGTLIFERDSVTIPYGIGFNNGSVEVHGITNTNAGAKMTLFNDEGDYFIYSLCGTLPESVTELYQSGSFVQVSPIPASQHVNFKITPPSNTENYELVIFDSAFQTIKKSAVSGGKVEINLDCETLSSGGYFYSLNSKNKIFQTGKFIISK
jgi:hypothetical protein